MFSICCLLLALRMNQPALKSEAFYLSRQINATQEGLLLLTLSLRENCMSRRIMGRSLFPLLHNPASLCTNP